MKRRLLICMGIIAIISTLLSGCGIVKSKTPLIRAIHNSNYSKVNALLKAGADINTSAEGESTPLIEAIYSDYSKKHDDMKMIKLLLENGADITVRSGTKIENITPLQHAAWYSEDPKVLKLLIDYKADVNVDNGDVLRTIISSTTRRNPRHMTTPMDFDRLAFVKVLVENGADVNLSGGSDGNTALHEAAQKHEIEIVQYLIDHKAAIDKKNKEGRTPLVYACYWAGIEGTDMDKRIEVLKILLENGAAINQTDNGGKSALDYMDKEYAKEMAAFLKRNGAKTGEELK